MVALRAMEALSVFSLAVVERRGHTDEPPGKNGRSSVPESFVCDQERPSGGDPGDSGSEPIGTDEQDQQDQRGVEPEENPQPVARIRIQPQFGYELASQQHHLHRQPEWESRSEMEARREHGEIGSVTMVIHPIALARLQQCRDRHELGLGANPQ